MSRLDETIQAKIEKRHKLEAAGVLIHPYNFDKKNSVGECRDAKPDVVVKTAGRLRSVRTHGKIAFFDLEDQTGKIQVMLREDDIGEKLFNLIPFIDVGDFMGVEGKVSLSKTQEITLFASTFVFLGKSLRPLPTEWNSSDDKEVRFRKRYIDMLVNPATKKVLDSRWLIEKEVRRYLQDVHDFVEVETPVLQPLYGGTNAKPFTTHMNALDTDFYLRLAPELYLKRLIVGGYDRIFEIARNFRNEGIDQTHQPEFTMIEWYQTYADYQVMMDTAEGLFKHLVKKLYNGTTIEVGDKTVDVGGKWPRIRMVDALKEELGVDAETCSEAELEKLLAKHDLKLIGSFNRGKAVFSLFDHLITKKLIRPTWITDYPKEVSPLAKQHRMFPDFVERFECYIAGKELMDGWSELTDPIDQRSRFENEQKHMREGDDEAHPVDEDFLEAMEHGLPPLGGIGCGIDRLVMFLTNTWSIREVIAFPTLRPIGVRPIDLQKKKEAEAGKISAAKPAAEKPAAKKSGAVKLPSRADSEKLLKTHIKNAALLHHCYMVAEAMEAYGKALGEDPELWYQTGLLHDIDWEEFPNEHPNKAVAEWLNNYPQELKDAILAHAPSRTNKAAETLLEKYVFACDELVGLMHAISLMRPNGFADMEVKSVKKKLKDKGFAVNVSREDIDQGLTLIGKTADEHVGFLIEVFKK